MTQYDLKDELCQCRYLFGRTSIQAPRPISEWLLAGPMFVSSAESASYRQTTTGATRPRDATVPVHGAIEAARVALGRRKGALPNHGDALANLELADAGSGHGRRERRSKRAQNRRDRNEHQNPLSHQPTPRAVL